MKSTSLFGLGVIAASVGSLLGCADVASPAKRLIAGDTIVPLVAKSRPWSPESPAILHVSLQVQGQSAEKATNLGMDNIPEKIAVRAQVTFLISDRALSESQMVKLEPEDCNCGIYASRAGSITVPPEATSAKVVVSVSTRRNDLRCKQTVVMIPVLGKSAAKGVPGI